MRNTVTIEEIDTLALNYLENYKKVNPDCFSKLIFLGAKASDILKYLKITK